MFYNISNVWHGPNQNQNFPFIVDGPKISPKFSRVYSKCTCTCRRVLIFSRQTGALSWRNRLPFSSPLKELECSPTRVVHPLPTLPQPPGPRTIPFPGPREGLRRSTFRFSSSRRFLLQPRFPRLWKTNGNVWIFLRRLTSTDALLILYTHVSFACLWHFGSEFSRKNQCSVLFDKAYSFLAVLFHHDRTFYCLLTRLTLLGSI